MRMTFAAIGPVASTPPFCRRSRSPGRSKGAPLQTTPGPSPGEARNAEQAWVRLHCRDWLTWEVGDLAGWVASLPRGCRVGGSDWLCSGATGGGGTRRHGCRWDGRPDQEWPDSAARITTAAMPVSLYCIQREASHRERCAGCRRRDPVGRIVVPENG
jgi:hypothetical protein